MNEFIVWYSNDINEDKFSQEFTLDQLIGQDHLDYISDSKFLVNYKVDSINDGIGLKDINGKSIYADSSIVEFDKCSQDGHSEKLKGFIRESSPMLFQIVILDNHIWNVLYWHEFRHSIKNIKIIDTIQENKLGLIK
jgi:hypothetical protein